MWFIFGKVAIEEQSMRELSRRMAVFLSFDVGACCMGFVCVTELKFSHFTECKLYQKKTKPKPTMNIQNGKYVVN